MKLSGSITISRSSNDRINIRVRDEASGVEFVEASMTPEAFGYAVTALSGQKVEIEVRELDKLGMKREHKDEIVPFDRWDSSSEETERLALEAVAQFEVDGWVGRVRDVMNHHNRTKGGYRVVFERWVKIEEE